MANVDKIRYNKIWRLILLVLAVWGCLGTLRVLLVVPIFMPDFGDFDLGGPSEFRLSATPAVWVPLALTMIATIALLILKEIRIDDKRKCLSTNLNPFLLSYLTAAIIETTARVPVKRAEIPNLGKRTPGPDLVESPIPFLDLSMDHGLVVWIFMDICIRFVERSFGKEGYRDRLIHSTGYAIQARSCLAEEGS